METQDTHSQPRHPIGVVRSRTGLSPEILRAWERRYEAVVPGRSPGGHRLYSDRDIERLQLLRRLVQSGWRIGDVARRDLEELRGLEREHLASRLERDEPLASGTAPEISELFADAMRAVEELDRYGLERVLGEATVALTPAVFRHQFVVPLMKTIGDRWHDGSLRVAHEHLASEVVHAYIFGLQPTRAVLDSELRMVVATLGHSRHELGALLAASIALDEGWQVSYLGAEIPPEEIAAAVAQQGAQAVALSSIFSRDLLPLERDLRRLRQLMGEDVALFLGGDGFLPLASVLDEIGARLFRSLDDFAAYLQGPQPRGS